MSFDLAHDAYNARSSNADKILVAALNAEGVENTLDDS